MHPALRRAKRLAFALLGILLLPFLFSLFALVGFNDDTGDNWVWLAHGEIQVHHDRNSGGPWRHPPIDWDFQALEPGIALGFPQWRLRKLAPYCSSTMTSDPMTLHFMYQWQVVLPLWIPLAIVLPAATVLWWWDRRLSITGRCRRCKYDLAGLTSRTCPECGSTLASVARGSTHAA